MPIDRPFSGSGSILKLAEIKNIDCKERARKKEVEEKNRERQIEEDEIIRDLFTKQIKKFETHIIDKTNDLFVIVKNNETKKNKVTYYKDRQNSDLLIIGSEISAKNINNILRYSQDYKDERDFLIKSSLENASTTGLYFKIQCPNSKLTEEELFNKIKKLNLSHYKNIGIEAPSTSVKDVLSSEGTISNSSHIER